MTHRAELLVRDLAVAVGVGEDDGLIDDLLQLAVLQVVAHHHLEHGEQLAVTDVAVLVHVVDLEGDCVSARATISSVTSLTWKCRTRRDMWINRCTC